jgi:hypothetical protein
MKLCTYILAFLIIFFSGWGNPVNSQSAVHVTIDVAAPRKPVSPLIYGKNNSLYDGFNGTALTSAQWQLLRDAGVRMFRESGGNNSTKYNWRKKLSSHPDWYNNVYPHDWDYAAGTLLQNIPGAYGMWTLPLIGKAAKSRSFNFNDWDYNRSQWWEGCAQNLAGGGLPNTSGGKVAQKEGNPDLYLENWPPDSVVGILGKWFGPAGLGYDQTRLSYWNMDNEPEIWNGTHDDVMATLISAESFMQRWFDTAKKARAVFPGIKLVGPVPANEWQWYNWNGDRILSGGKYYTWLEYFIKRIGEEQKASGVRLLDVLDIHFYPHETGSADILQTHRIFFDKTYIYPGHNGVHRLGASGWDTSINREFIFERCREWLVKYIGSGHGVTFSLSETSTASGTPVNVNATWYASMLGEFMKQGVEIFTPWDWKPGMYEILHLFTRFNHDSYLDAVSSDELNISAYTTVNKQADSMTVVLVNRSTMTAKEVQVKISNYSPEEGYVYYYRIADLPATETFKSKTSNATKSGTSILTGNTVSMTLPPLSVTSLLIRGTTLHSDRIKMFSRSANFLSVYPNPAGTWCMVKWPANLFVSARLEVFAPSGARIHDMLVKGEKEPDGGLRISTKDWSAGLYLVRITSDSVNGSSVLRVIH